MNSYAEFRQIGARCWVAGAIFVLLGLVAFCGGRSVQTYIDRVAQWPSVSGEIVTSRVTTATVRTGRVLQTSDVADIRYAYAVKGVDYRGEHLRLLPMLHMKPEGTPQELVSRYPVGRSVQVYYNPADPSAAVLIPEVAADARNLIRSFAVMGPLVALMGLLIAGIGVVCWFGKPDSPPETAPRAVIAPKVPPQVQLGLVQRVMRGAATALGLFVFLLGSLLLVAAARTPNPSGDESTRIVAMFIVGGAAFLGAGLTYAGVRRPRMKSPVATA